MRIFIKICVVFAAIILLNFGGVNAAENKKAPVSSSIVVVDISVEHTSDLHLCYEDRFSAEILLLVENNGSDTLRNIQLGWFLAVDQTGSVNWTGNLAPGNSKSVSLTRLNFPNSGSHQVQLWVASGTQDVNKQNDTVIISVQVDPPFLINDLVDTAKCANSSAVLNIAPGYLSYQWSTGHTTSSLTAATGGNYTVTVTNVQGCVAIDSMSLQEHLAPLALLPPDTVLCDSTILIPEVSPRFLSYSWGMGDTISNIVIDEEGDYVLSVVDTFGCEYTDTINVQYAAPPIPTIPTQIFICDGDSALLSVSSTFNSYNWSTGATGNSISTTSPGVYYVTVTGIAGCVGFDTVQVLVNPLPVMSFSDSLMCNLNPILLNVGWFNSFRWSNGDTIQNPIIYAPGTYSVTVTDQNGCENSDSVLVQNTNVSVSLGNDTSICSGDGSFIILDVYDSYLWDDGHTGPSQFIGDAGVYSVTVTMNGCTAIDEMEVTEVDYPEANYSENLLHPTVDFTNTSNITSNILWEFGDGNTSTLLNPSHTYLNPGLFEVTLTVSNQCGIDTKTKSIGVFPLGNNNIDVVELFSVFPTITQDVINIRIEGLVPDELEYYIYDITGKLLMNQKEYSADNLVVTTFDVSNYASGTYVLKVVTQNRLVGLSKFVKE